jgi:hypothetical protein
MIHPFFFCQHFGLSTAGMDEGRKPRKQSTQHEEEIMEWKRIKQAAATLALIAMVALTGCSKDDDPIVGPKPITEHELVGTWELIEYSYPMDDSVITMPADGEETLIFEADGTGTVRSLYQDDSFRWSAKGDQLTVTMQGEVSECRYSLKSGRLTMVWDDYFAMVYEKR